MNKNLLIAVRDKISKIIIDVHEIIDVYSYNDESENLEQISKFIKDNKENYIIYILKDGISNELKRVLEDNELEINVI